jgi:hypothetical protein
MIETTPFPGVMPVGVPEDAVTVELTEDEVREALAAYVGRKRGENWPAYAICQICTGFGTVTRVVFTYWRLKEPALTCDGAACKAPVAWECYCPRCSRDGGDRSERFHACGEHRALATAYHQKVRERPAQWSRL